MHLLPRETPTPPYQRQAAAAGKHVLCEKPCAVSLSDLEEMAEACAAAGVLLMDGVMFMHDARLEVEVTSTEVLW